MLAAIRRSRGDSDGLQLVVLISVLSGLLGLGLAEVLAPVSFAEALKGTGAPLLIAAFSVYLVVLTAIRATGKTSPLCTTGFYRWSRNPAAVAFLLPLAAIGCFSVTSAAVAILVYIVAMTNLVIRDEERMLRVRHGAAFEDYQRSVPRWLLG